MLSPLIGQKYIFDHIVKFGAPLPTQLHQSSQHSIQHTVIDTPSTITCQSYLPALVYCVKFDHICNFLCTILVFIYFYCIMLVFMLLNFQYNFAKIVDLFLYLMTNKFCYSHMADLFGIHRLLHNAKMTAKNNIIVSHI